MGVDFDVAEFCRKLRPQDPPYTCPVETCKKLYHSIVGLNYHLTKFDHNNPTESESTALPSQPKHPHPAAPPNLAHSSAVTSMTPKTPANKISHPKPRSSLKSSRKKKSAQRANLLKNAVDQKMVIPSREGLTYAEAQTMVEFDHNGASVRYKISDPLLFTSRETFESEFGQANVKQESNDSMSQTPISSKKHTHSSSSKKKSNKMGSTATPAAAPEEKVRLPEPCFKILDNYNIADAPPRPTLAYIRFIERSAEEMDGEVEYDMDEEDTAWLSIINERRGSMSLPPVPIDAFELLMDRLEKESYFQMQVNGPPGDSAPSIIDDDAVCCICMDGECQNSNVILFCDMCNLAVHQDCYGVPYIPEGQWLCRRCLQSPSRAVDCVLCPNNGGAFKQTDRSLWAHVVCALWIPEVRFANTVFLEPIDSIETIPPARWKLTCYICKQKGVGACIQCHKTNCYAAFHVTCAQHAGLYMKMDTVRDSEPGPVMVQKTAYCDAHTPPDAEPRPKINSRTGGGILAVSPPGDFGSPGSAGSGSPDRPREEKREKMKEARRILAKRRSSMPIISIPTIPPERIQEIASLVSLPKKNQFIQRLIAYWTLKRQFRNGVPLLRRLQSSHPQRRDDGRSADATNDTAELFRQLKYWQCLRQDLERARLLCELVRKREKMKREYIKVVEAATLLKLNPFQNFLMRVLENLQAKDNGEIFAEPVDLDEVPDYSDVVKEPMDLSTMRLKIERFEYQSLDDLQKDFNLMIANCLAYNSKDTVFYRAGVRMRDQGGAVLRQARRDIDVIGFDPETGLLSSSSDSNGSKQKSVSFRSARKSPEKRSETPDSEPSEPTEKSSKTTKIADALSIEIDSKLNHLVTKGSGMELSKMLSTLLELQDMAQMLKSPVARNKRARAIRMEIAKVRRKMSISEKKSSKQVDTDTADTNTDEDESTECEEDPVPTKAESRIHEDSPGKKRDSENSSKWSQRPQSSTDEKSYSSGKRGRKRRYQREDSDDDRDTPAEGKAIAAAQMSASTTPEKDSFKGSNASALTTPVTPVHSEGLNDSPSGLNSSKGSLSSSSPSGVNRRTAVLFTRKAAGVFRKPDAPGSPASMNSEPGLPVPIKRRAGRPRKNLDASLSSESCSAGISSSNMDKTADSESRLMPAPPAPVLNSDSFRVYRSGGDMVTETDEDSQSETSCSSCSSTEDLSGSSCCEEEGDEDADSGASSLDCTSPRAGSGDEGDEKREKNVKGPLLPPLQLVWAKCRGYPWYPALIIDPKMPAGYVHHGVPIPAPPPEVLALSANYSEPVHLVLFFDTKRTWQWLPRNKLELLGEDRSVDQSKLTESRKPTDRKAVRKAYQEAMLHRREVTGIDGGLIDDTEALDETT